jgi:NAD+ synthetase
MATGYTTLYGDMCGALGVLGDVLKTQVYELARWMNGHHAALGMAGPPIPHRCLTRPPSAELRPDQTDQDTLPPYEVLDEIVARVIDQDLSAERIARETGNDLAFIEQAMEMIDRAQYKRDQAGVVPKVSARAFGRGRPMPIVMKNTCLERVVGAGAEEGTEARRHEGTKGGEKTEEHRFISSSGNPSSD